MKILRPALFAFFISTIALILSDQVLYKYWFIPQSASMQNAPFFYEYIVLLPIALAILIFGVTISSWKQMLVYTIIFALNHQCYDFFTGKSHHSQELVRYIIENPLDFWFIRSLLILFIYSIAFGFVWYSKSILKKPLKRLITRIFSGSHKSDSPSGIAARQLVPAGKKNNNEDRMATRITYHVLPDPTGWLVKKGKAKKASSTHKTKRKALRAASDLAKNHPQSQVIIHKASGIIESDRTFEHTHYKKKKHKRAVIRKIRIGMKRSKRKLYEERLRRRKAARLGIARIKRKQYLRRLAAKKAARTRRRKRHR